MEKAKTISKLEKKAFVFIDGNNFYHNIKLMGINPSHIHFLKLSEFVCSRFNCMRGKTIYYNSVPSITDGEEMYYKHMKFLSELRSFPNFEVKTRKLQRSSTEEIIQEKKELVATLGLCNNCKPVVENNCSDCIGSIKKREKGVDVMIAIDMLNLAIIQKTCDCCILIAGDADFIPALDLIKSAGKEVFSAFLPKGYAHELREKNTYGVLNRDIIMQKCLK